MSDVDSKRQQLMFILFALVMAKQQKIAENRHLAKKLSILVENRIRGRNIKAERSTF